MALDLGSRLGVYEVTAFLGQGGMGRVYRARDTSLNRDVALKVLPDAFASDAERLARFTREAQTLAALNHPNVAQIHGLAEADGVRALVMELADGDDLAQRLARGPLPLDEALPIATRIAEALEAAHAQGIIHRDLKPANIKVAPGGAVKVLDFGLAKAIEPGPGTGGRGSGDVANSPTITSPALTQAGMILGTAAYMSPEQARGRQVDKRTDIWAFGCVLFEMLTGRRAFPGDDVTDTIAAVVRAEPAWDALPAETPPAIRRLLRRCLVKDAHQRLPDIGTARLELADAALEAREATAAAPAVTATTSPAPRRARLPWAVAGLSALGALAALGVAMRTPASTPAAPELRVEIETPPSPAPTQFAVSPDGTQLVAVASDNGQRKLWLRSLTTGSSRFLGGTEAAQTPFWSPDGRAIAFIVEGRRLRILDLDSSSISEVGERVNGFGLGGTWNRDGVLLWNGAGLWPLQRALATPGSPATEVTRLEAGQDSHRWPFFLPDGKHFVYSAGGLPQVRGHYLGSLDGAPPVLLRNGAGSAVYLRDHLLFLRGGALVAARLDVETRQLEGEHVEVVPTDGRDENAPGGGVSVSENGLIAFRRSAVAVGRLLIWLDRTGKEIGQIPEALDPVDPDISDDGQRLAVNRITSGSTERRVWTFEIARGVWTLSSPGEHRAIHSMWAPDGRRLVYNSNRDGKAGFYIRAWNRSDEREILGDVGLSSPRAMTPDGRYLLYDRVQDRSSDIWVAPMDGGTSEPVVQTPFEEMEAELSADGRWLAYRSNESGRFEIYVQPFGRQGERIQISNAGGGQPRWRRDGRELFYVGLDERLMAVPVRESPDGQSLEAGSPTPLFATRMPGGPLQPGGRHQQYDVSSDGQRFLLVAEAEGEGTPPITLIVNWQPPQAAVR